MIIPHAYQLTGPRITLRPLTEDDWGILLPWNQDPKVLYFFEGDDVRSYTLFEIQEIYREIAQSAFCFIIELDQRPIGEASLQTMNLSRILEQNPGVKCWRMDLMIGDKSLWGQGLGTETIRVLAGFAFLEQSADKIFACDIADYNPASMRAFKKAGFQIVNINPQPPGKKAITCADMVLTRQAWLKGK